MMEPVLDRASIAGKRPATERHVPLIVVGAGPAGVAAATAAARAGARVLLLDEHPLDPELMAMDVPLYFGQRMSEAVRDRGAMLERVVHANPAIEEAVEAGVEVELGVSVWGAFRPGPTLRELGGACLGVADQSRSWLIGYDRLIVAAGARDLGMAFRGWEKAGTMGAAGALALLTRYQACAARRMVVLGSGPLGLAVASARACARHPGARRGRGRLGRSAATREPGTRSSSRASASTRATSRPRRWAAATRSRGCASPRWTETAGRFRGARSTSPATRCASRSASCRRSSSSRSWAAGSCSAPSVAGSSPSSTASSAPACPMSSRPATAREWTSAP